MGGKQEVDEVQKQMLQFQFHLVLKEIDKIEQMVKESYGKMKKNHEELIKLRQALSGAIKYVDYKLGEDATTSMKATIEGLNARADKINTQINIIQHLIE